MKEKVCIVKSEKVSSKVFISEISRRCKNFG